MVGVMDVGNFVSRIVCPCAPTEICPFCQTHADSVRITGLAGCPLCYAALPFELWHEFGLEVGKVRALHLG